MLNLSKAVALTLTVCFWPSSILAADSERSAQPSCSDLVLQPTTTGPIVQAIRSGRLKQRDFTRGEFESSEEAGDRIRNRINQFSASAFHIAHVPLSGRTKPLRYDADSETMSLDRFFTSVHLRLRNMSHPLRVAEWEIQSGSYIGENAFGSKRRVAVRNQYILELALSQQDAERIPTFFKVPRASAAQFKKSAHLIAVLQPRSPYMSANSIRIEPRVDAPSDFVSTKFRLESELLCLAIKSPDGSADQILIDRSSHSS